MQVQPNILSNTFLKSISIGLTVSTMYTSGTTISMIRYKGEGNTKSVFIKDKK